MNFDSNVRFLRIRSIEQDQARQVVNDNGSKTYKSKR